MNQLHLLVLAKKRLTQKPLLYCLAIIIFLFSARCFGNRKYYRDPTSKFFDPSRAYEPQYTSFRQHEVDSFANLSASTSFRRKSTSSPFICLSMLTIARPSGLVYFQTSLESLLAGLSQFERDEIYVVPFIGHTNASQHPSYREDWLWNLADLVLTYNNSRFISQEEYIHVQDLEKEREKTGLPDREKHLFDYIQALKECQHSGAKYVGVFEDDILASDGWFLRMRRGLEEVERRTEISGRHGFFYLRLFYTEGLLGWNKEEWKMYLLWVLSVVALVAAIYFYSMRIRISLVQKNGKLLLGVTMFSTAFSIAFFFIAGRVSMLPMSVGVHEMTKYGCCAQAIVYPKDRVSILIKWYEEQKIGFVDTLAERLADEKPEVGMRWALTPSVVQHVGGRSSKGDKEWNETPRYVHGRTAGEALWNFGFELNDPQTLKAEHTVEASHLETAPKSVFNDIDRALDYPE